MTTAASDDIRINRLKVHGRRDDIDSVQRQMSQVNWPVDDKSWVFIRSLKVASTLHSVSNSLTHETRKVVSQADDSNVKIFHSLSELLSELIADIAQNLAPHKWYWEHWAKYLSLPASAAITEIFIDHRTETMSVLNRLNQAGKVVDVIRVIPEQDIAKLLYVQFPNKPELLKFASDKPDPSPTLTTPGLANVIKSWVTAFQSLALSKNHLVWLAANLAQHHYPIVWLKESRRLIDALIRIGSQHANQDMSTNFQLDPLSDLEKSIHIQRSFEVDSKDIRPTKPLFDSTFEVHANTQLNTQGSSTSSKKTLYKEVKPESKPLNTQQHKAPKLISTEAKNERHSVNSEHYSKINSEPTESQTADNLPTAATKAHQVQTNIDNHFEHTFATNFGGTFYLLNILNRQEAQLIMGQQWHQASHGLLWLHQLATHLGLPKQDGINSYITNELNIELIELTHLPMLEGLAGIITLARQWYGKANVWNTTLLELPATIEANESHIDMTVSDTLIDIDIRKMGLDVNPGWLPWLGKVVKFHFVSGG